MASTSLSPMPKPMLGMGTLSSAHAKIAQWVSSLVWIHPASRLILLTVHYSSNQPNSVFLSQQTSRNSVFQPSFRLANGAFISYVAVRDKRHVVNNFSTFFYGNFSTYKLPSAVYDSCALDFLFSLFIMTIC